MTLVLHLCLISAFLFTTCTAFCDTRQKSLLAQAKAAILYAPQPDYPPNALPRHASGAGTFRLRIRVSTGRVINVEIVSSTGYKTLDAAAIHTLSLWRFKPGALPPISVETPERADPHADEDCLIKVPISFVWRP
jgi:TonB family protein